MKDLDKATIVKVIIILVIITILTSLSVNILTSLVTSLIIGITLIVTNYLFNINKRLYDILLILISSAVLSLYYFILYNYIDIFGIACIFVFIIVLFCFVQKTRKQK